MTVAGCWQIKPPPFSRPLPLVLSPNPQTGRLSEPELTADPEERISVQNSTQLLASSERDSDRPSNYGYRHGEDERNRASKAYPRGTSRNGGIIHLGLGLLHRRIAARMSDTTEALRAPAVRSKSGGSAFIQVQTIDDSKAIRCRGETKGFLVRWRQ